MTDKLIRDGKVAVVYSPGYGAGWSTWNDEHTTFCLFDRHLAELVLAKRMGDALAYVEARELNLYTGGLHDAKVGWVPQGTPFHIDEHDGSERIVTNFHIA